MKYKAVLFDLDGTLLDTLADLAYSVNAVLNTYGYPEHAVDAYRYFVGEGIKVLVQRAFPVGTVSEENLDQMVEAVEAEYAVRWIDHTLPYPGVPEMLSYLEEKDIPKAILSNKPHKFTVKTTEALLPDWFFTAVYGIEDGMPKKPDPFGALKILQGMGIEPHQALFLGDTGTDMVTATKGGLFPVGVLWGFRPAEELLKAGARALLNHPLEIKEII